MSELRDTLRRVAERGTPVGPDAVYRRAVRAARQKSTPPSRPHRERPRRGWPPLLAVACILILIAAVLVIASDDGSKRTVVVGPSKRPGTGASTPRPGGDLVYGLESDTLGRWCLPIGQLSPSGLKVVAAIYDTLTVPARGRDGSIRYAPYLAQSIRHNAAYTVWSIKLRAGIRFQNGEPLTAAVVKRNLDQYRGSLPFQYVLADISDVQAVDQLTVRVVTKVPWVAFDAFLYLDGRLGIVAPAQLDDATTCLDHPIGTGPFKFVRQQGNESLTVERNPFFWRRDPAGRRLPYLDRIEFRTMSNAAERVRALEDGRVDIIENTDPRQLLQLRRDAGTGSVQLAESDLASSLNYLALNVSQPPFNDRTARLALARALNLDQIITKTQAGAVRRAVQPFTNENIAYVDPSQLHFPGFDRRKARTLVRLYERSAGHPLHFRLLIDDDPRSAKVAQLIRQQVESVGITVQLTRQDPVALTNTVVVSGDYEATLWRGHGGGDPDTQSPWWSSAQSNEYNQFNLGRVHDPEMDRLLAAGRSETAPARRAQIYQAVTKRLAAEAYDLWGWYTRSATASLPNVEGLQQPRLPSGDDPVSLAGAQPVVGLWQVK